LDLRGGYGRAEGNIALGRQSERNVAAKAAGASDRGGATRVFRKVRI
jgi:hypothetical protein